MKILFLVHNLGKTRHFEGVIQGLADRGHNVVITAAHKRNKPLKLGSFAGNPRVDDVAGIVRKPGVVGVRPDREDRDEAEREQQGAPAA